MMIKMVVVMIVMMGMILVGLYPVCLKSAS